MNLYVLPDHIVDKIAFEPNTSHWLWTAATRNGGYGTVRWEGRMAAAHRLVYSLLVGPIPPGLQIDHICRVRACVNPDHLRLVTLRQNVLTNSKSCSALNAAKTHCVRGHAFDVANTYHPPRGRKKRDCRACGRIEKAAQKARRLEAERAVLEGRGQP